MEQIKLTQFSPGAGCGCKISPKDLESILHSNSPQFTDTKLLVGNQSKDDAAVYDMGNGEAIISTTDFFTPIVDDPFTFGAIASVNAISDVYAMGGTPFMAIAILGWPLKKLSTEIAQKVIEGSRSICQKAGIALAGGHSIDIEDPIFGLAVTGKVRIEHLKQNSTATANCKLFLTKPIGIGILTTAQKNHILKTEDSHKAVDIMLQLNSFGAELGKLPQVKAMTDVTGFGLLGHLLEMCEGSSVNAKLYFDKVPKINGIDEYMALNSFPGGTFRNWKSYGHKISEIQKEKYVLLADPQTSGGLLVAVDRDGIDEFLQLSQKQGINVHEIGELCERTNTDEKFVEVIL